MDEAAEINLDAPEMNPNFQTVLLRVGVMAYYIIMDF